MNQRQLQDMLLSAVGAARVGQREAAMGLYEEIIGRFGEQPIALNALGMDALARSDFKMATHLFGRATRADVLAPDLWMNLAKAEREQGNHEGERIALEGALAIDQRHFMALVRLAELHERVGNVTSAAERWGNVLSVATAMVDRAPALEAMLEHAREYVSRRHTTFALEVDNALSDARRSISTADLRRFDACIDHALGRRPIYANQCAGLHFPFLPAEEFFGRAHFPWLADIEAQSDIIREELTAVLGANAEAVLPYVAMASGTPANKWSPLDGSLAWGAMHLWKDGVRNDDICARFPRTAAAVEKLPLCDLPGRTPTVFFSILQPKAHLPAHTGVSNVRTIVHLPLIVPDGCIFRVGGETRAWEEGKAWAFDDTIDHEAWNNSDSLRAILIFDVWNPYITFQERDLLRQFYRVSMTVDSVSPISINVSD